MSKTGRLSEFLATEHDFDMSLQWLNSSEDWCWPLRYLLELAWYLCCRGGMLLQEGEADEAEPHLIESFKMAVSWNERGLLAYNEQRLAMEIPLALGIIFYMVGLFTLFRQIYFLRKAVAAKCWITRLESVYESLPAGPNYIIGVKKDVPVIWFKTGNGTNIIAKLPPAHVGTYDIEQNVVILYDPAKPQKIALPSLDYWYLPLVLFVLGTVCFVGLLV